MSDGDGPVRQPEQPRETQKPPERSPQQELARTQQALATQIAYATSDEAVYAWAYQEGRWVREGDIPVAPLPPPGSTPEPTLAPVMTQEPENNWDIWMSLFLDE